ncbi:hypothetical protein [Hymenobacter sp.]|jgi:phosphoglycerol transferase MdoB-like AlkP superfamily enzyme|uniref:hypothetical protein n=1 Tax=Hymenobacter sp. TaxID=1898978 RepID=UPI002ED9AC29
MDFFNGQEYFRTISWYWLPTGLWLLLASIGLLALVLGLLNAFQRRVGRTVAWLGLGVLAIGSCAAAFFPVVLFTVNAPSVGDPPPDEYER